MSDKNDMRPADASWFAGAGRCRLIPGAVAVAMAVWGCAAYAQFQRGDILIIDQQYGSSVGGYAGGLYRVKPSGARVLVSDFNDPAQGPTGGGSAVGVSGIAAEAAGTVVVTDRASGTAGRGRIFRITSAGARSVVTDFGNAAQGQIAAQPTGIVLDANGNILAATLQISGAQPFGVLFRVNRANGNRTVISDFNDAALGPVGKPFGLAVEANGRVLAVDPNGGTNANGALLRIHQATGVRTLLSDFGDLSQGPLGKHPTGVAVDSAGAIWVVDQAGGIVNSNIGVLFRVDPTTGYRTLVSDFSDPQLGPTGRVPTGVAVDPADRLLVVDTTSASNGFSGSLFRVDRVTGQRELLNDFSTAPTGQTPTGVLAFAACGDGVPDFIEECDDGNTLGGDGCSEQCRVEPGFVACSKRIANMVGTEGPDTIVGTGDADVIHGLGGNDTLLAGGGRDVVCGGAGDDTIRGGSSNDVLEGGPGKDVLIGGNGKDTIKGDSGDDLMRGGDNADTCNGGTHVTGDTAIDCETVFNVP